MNEYDQLDQLDRIARPIVRRILRMYPNDVDDVMQSAMLNFIQHRGQFEGRSKLSSWFVSIAINQARMFLRPRRMKEELTVDANDEVYKIFDNGPSPEVQAMRAETRAILRKEIKKLNPAPRRAAYFFLKNDLVGPKNNKKSLFLARKAMRQSFAAQNLVLSKFST